MNFAEQDCIYLQLALKDAITNAKSSLATKSVEERARIRLIIAKWKYLKDLTVKCVGDIAQ